MKSDQIAIIATVSILTIIFLVLELRKKKKSSTTVKLSNSSPPPQQPMNAYCAVVCRSLDNSCYLDCSKNPDNY